MCVLQYHYTVIYHSDTYFIVGQEWEVAGRTGYDVSVICDVTLIECLPQEPIESQTQNAMSP